MIIESGRAFDIFDPTGDSAGEGMLLGVLRSDGRFDWDTSWRAPGGQLTFSAFSGETWGMWTRGGTLTRGTLGKSPTVVSGAGTSWSATVVEGAWVWSVFGRGLVGLSPNSGTPVDLWSGSQEPGSTVGSHGSTVSWVSVSGPNASSGTYDTARWRSARLTQDTAGLRLDEIVTGPLLNARFDLLRVARGPDLAATVGCNQVGDVAECSLHVWRISSGEAWQIKPRAGRGYAKVIAVGQNHVLAVDSAVPSPPAQAIIAEQLVRLEVDQLSATSSSE